MIFEMMKKSKRWREIKMRKKNCKRMEYVSIISRFLMLNTRIQNIEAKVLKDCSLW